MEDDRNVDEEVQDIKRSVGSRTNRQSASIKSNRRSTFLVRPLDQSEPPADNPNNTPQRNAELRREYETLQAMNRTLETVNENFSKTFAQISEFAQTVNRTDALLDIWLEILQKTEQTRTAIENPDLVGLQAEKRKNPNDHKKGYGIRKRRLNE